MNHASCLFKCRLLKYYEQTSQNKTAFQLNVDDPQMCVFSYSCMTSCSYDLDPMTLICKYDLDILEVYLHIKTRNHQVNSYSLNKTDRHTHTCRQMRANALPAAFVGDTLLKSCKKFKCNSVLNDNADSTLMSTVQWKASVFRPNVH